MKTKIIGWYFILLGAATLAFFSYVKLTDQVEVQGPLLVILLFPLFLLTLGYFTLKENTWGLWVGLVFLFLQMFGFQTPEFSFLISTPVDLSMSFSLTDKSTGLPKATFFINAVAIVMCILMVDVVKGKKRENS